jgi:hypothetical protein
MFTSIISWHAQGQLYFSLFHLTFLILCSNGTRSEANPFEEEEWDEEGGEALVDTGEPGVPVKALYDYVGQESDELSFQQGARTVLKWSKMSVTSES